KIKSNKDFFEKGIQLRKTYTESCPFCEATNREDEISNIINAYKSIYDDSYNKSVSLFNEKKKSIIEEVELLLKNVQKNYSQIFLKLKEYQEKFHIPSIYSIEEEKNIKSVDLSFLNAFLNTIKNLSSPSKLAIEDDYSKIKQFIENQQKAFDDLYGLFDEKNAIINKFKNENTDTLIKDRLESNQRLISSKTHSINFIQEGKIEKQREKEDRELQLKKIEREIQSIKQDVTEVKKEFEEYVSTEAFKKTLERIQYYFEKFNFGFKLELDTSKPKGAATKEVTFSFKVLDKDDNPRSFNEGLSEGQLHVLSICFFLAFIDIQDRKEEKIIVFDDPINSLDNSNIGFFVDILFDKKDEISQLLVLTHHKTFYKFIQKKFKTSDGLNSFGNEYLIIRNEKRYGGSFIVKSQRDSLKDKLKKFIDNPIPAQQIPYIDIESRIIEHGQYLRYELERFVKNDLLQWNQDKFPTLVSGITTNRFLEDNDLESLKKVYQFCNWTTSHVDHGDDHGLEQLKIYIKLFLEVMERFHIAKNNSTNSNNQP
ncbi:MAG TPA: AAA family ATPase, partial [Leptospiraceae bacterium]|nr:AAA family ATPase [Leptospiraceae bacterium]